MVKIIQKFHEIGYVYNDFKPDNICIGEYQKPYTDHLLKLIDFGLATKYKNQMGEHIKSSSCQSQGNIAFRSPYQS